VYYYRKAFSATLAEGAFFVSEAMEKKVKKRSSGGRAGCRGGGWLKSGNTVNVGRKPSEVRAEIMSTVGEATAVMRSIVDGKFRQDVRNAAGEIVDHRLATISEVVLVWKALAGHALPQKPEVIIEDQRPMVEVDYSMLTREEKEQLLAISEKMQAGHAARAAAAARG